MIELRPFLNDDSPAIVDIWNQQPRLHARLHPLTTNLLETHVLAKPYFDPCGLLIAHDGERRLGFVHAGFAAGHAPGELNCQQGIICQLLVLPGPRHLSDPRSGRVTIVTPS